MSSMWHRQTYEERIYVSCSDSDSLKLYDLVSEFKFHVDLFQGSSMSKPSYFLYK